ncbi:MAG: sugar transferase [Clostridiales bacterium]|nr:sugar transferase [Clostridiales bacterium]
MKIKRLFDIFFSAAGIVVLLPFMGVVCAVVYFDDGGPVVFKQDRVGKDGKLFKLKKFRTMKNGTRTVATKDLVDSHKYITRCGRFMRRNSIDEIPQLFNILKGNMSFVGPRPLIPTEVHMHSMREAYGVYKVCPGMTGLAQVSGRDTITDERKAELDKEYVDNMSLLGDVKIMIMTAKAVFKGENVHEGGSKDRAEKRVGERT